MAKPTSVTTTHGNRYRLGRELGRGGQGAVYTVEGARLAVKLLRDRSTRARERLRDQLAMVGRLPLEDLAVARPIEQLRAPEVGYVMELVTGMVPLRELMRPPPETNSLARWYLDGGGLRRRLRVLARTAEVFAELHGRSLVYVDPSPHNVFVSAESDALEVRLIDTDNLRSSSVDGSTVYTPAYGAPELVSGKALPSTLSDAHAFAVMAFETLTLAHPLLGDEVRDGDPELEERALSGELPWIDDAEDSSNRSSDGIPREVVLSPGLRDDFAAAFGAGLSDPSSRPGLGSWTTHLHRAADRTVACPRCTGTFYFNHSSCPWCDTPRPSFVIAAVFIWDPRRRKGGGLGSLEEDAGILRDPRGKPRVVDAIAVSANESLWLTERVTGGTNSSAPRLRVTNAHGRLILEAQIDEPWRLVSLDGQNERALGSAPVDLALRGASASWLVHTGPDDRLHRVIRFDRRPEVER